MPVRIYDIAKKLGIESKEDVGTLVTLQFPQKNRRVKMLK